MDPMTPESPSSTPPDKQALDPLSLYRSLRFPRTIEEKMLRLIRQGRISKWFSGYGQEAISVGSALALTDEDYILPTHRNLGVWTTRGVPLEPLFCQLMGRAGGYTKGRDRTFHFGLPEKKIIGMISHVGAMLPVACGFGLASVLRDERTVTLIFSGEGATREGDFHEALNLAAVWKLPVIFVVENNGYGLSTPTSDVIAVDDIADAAAGYGMPGIVVDGNDIFSVMRDVDQAAVRARAGGGPTLLEMKTFRMRGHEEASGTKYVPDELLADWGQKDPLLRLRAQLLEDSVASTSDLEAIDKELERLVHVAAESAIAQPPESSSSEAEIRDVFAPSDDPELEPGPQGRERRFIDAISDGLSQAMEADDAIVLLGQDIAGYGGVFKVTSGFAERFGTARVRNTPIIESGVIGAGLGLALAGFKPVIEMQYADFITCGFNQVVNNLATTRYRWGESVNVTIRAPFGGSIGAGPFHSQSPEAWFCHVPGLKVVVPGTPYDAKGLLLQAIADPNPVLFFEQKHLYRSLRGDVPDDPYRIALGRATIAQEGTDATMVTYGIGRVWALEEAAAQKERGRSIEVVDLRTLVPFDQDMVLESVRKTGRVLILHEAAQTAGFGAEIAARICETAFDALDAPPIRVAALDIPIPFSRNLEESIYSAKSRLHVAVERLLAY
ncbi:MAG TPA: dehydrogenase E1 component subunit alpha/beta [Rhodothermales bacterium]|nr:dehydrogenase E1 component subunit alpha/beta [Rhodothermales bacterium]